jgi:hypothetical protein
LTRGEWRECEKQAQGIREFLQKAERCYQHAAGNRPFGAKRNSIAEKLRSLAGRKRDTQALRTQEITYTLGLAQ